MATAIVVLGIMAGFALLASYAGEPAADVPFRVESRGNPVRVVPVLGRLEPLVLESVARRWEQENPEEEKTPELVRLTGVEIVEVQRADCLLDASRGGHIAQKPETETPVYLVQAFARAAWWKLTTDHALVLVKRGDDLKELFHFSGGWNGRGISCRFENIGSGHPGRMALVIEDYASGNQQSRTRLHMFCYDEEGDTFAEVFNDLVDYSGGVGPFKDESVLACFSSEWSFRESDGDVKDIVVRTSVGVYPPGDNTLQYTDMVTEFRWNGERYVGDLHVPGFTDD